MLCLFDPFTVHLPTYTVHTTFGGFIFGLALVLLALQFPLASLVQKFRPADTRPACHATALSIFAMTHAAYQVVAVAPLVGRSLFDYDTPTHGGPPADTRALFDSLITPSAVLASYLLSDAVGLLFSPKYSMSIFIHHVLFGALTVTNLCGKMYMLDYPWLAIGELSSVPLNAAFILRPGSTPRHYAEIAFAVTFTVCRVAMYPVGMYAMFARTSWSLPPAVAPPAAFLSLFLLPVAYALNLYWFTQKIIPRLLAGPAKRNKKE